MEPRPGFADTGSRDPVPGGSRDFGPLRERARRDAITIEIEPATDGTRLAWSVPLRPSKRSGRAS
jgi:hypothetical protein